MFATGHYRNGRFDRQLDAKGRLSLPVDWRPPVGESLYLVKVTVEGIPALRALTQEAFDRKLRDIEESTILDPAQKDRARGILFGSAVSSKVNEQGKMTIPKALAESHNLSLPGSACIVGRGELFEILTPENGAALEIAEDKKVDEDPQLNSVLGFTS